MVSWLSEVKKAFMSESSRCYFSKFSCIIPSSPDFLSLPILCVPSIFAYILVLPSYIGYSNAKQYELTQL